MNKFHTCPLRPFAAYRGSRACGVLCTECHSSLVDGMEKKKKDDGQPLPLCTMRTNILLTLVIHLPRLNDRAWNGLAT
jgi:hypothetical protein